MEKMKKPDFLGEINKEILEELTKRGRARNVAGLVGEVKELAEVTQICGLPFAGYLGKIEIPRPSGIKDEVAVAFEQDTPYKAAQGELDVLQEVYDRYLQITGYCKCCLDCEFIDKKSADDLMCLAAYLAGNEQDRAEAQQRAERAGKGRA